MDEKTTNKLKLKESFLKHGLLYFLVGVALIMTYYCVNHVGVIASGVAKINDILMPFYLGIIMAYLMCPLYNATVRGIYRAKKGRSKAPVKELRLAKFFATIVAVAAILGIVTGFFALIGPDLWDSVTGLVLGIPDATAKVQDWINNHIVENPALVDLLEDKLENISTMAIDWAQQKLLPGASAILSGVVGTLGMVADFFVALIICIYILNSKETFSGQSKKLVLAVCKPQKAEKIFTFGKICNETFGGFINGKIIDSIIIGILCFFAMTVLKLPMAILISVVVGVTNIIPIKDLKNTSGISELCHSTDEPVFITKNGYSDMVVMSNQAYDKLIEQIHLYQLVAEAEQDVEEGNVFDGEEVLSEMRAKYGY